MEIVVIFIFIKNSKFCDKYYSKRRLDKDLKIKTETEEVHGRTCGIIKQENNFLINRRKKEFGIYMTLGMGKKRQISKIILMETILVGIISLIVGLIIGVFASQFMSILVAKMFEADMSKFQFVFSKDACIKTCIYFAVMYVAVMFFNTFTVSKYKLIDLLNASKKNEKCLF